MQRCEKTASEGLNVIDTNNHQRYLSPLDSNHREREEMFGYLKSGGLS